LILFSLEILDDLFPPTRLVKEHGQAARCDLA
jgi:hypothetical protein